MLDLLKKLFYPIIAVLDFITKYFKTVVFLTIVYFFVSSSNEANMNESYETANLQKIELYGPILNVEKVMMQIEEAKNDNNIVDI